MGGVGGVKRPAEGSKEAPSEKKNLPIIKTYNPKSNPTFKSSENHPPSHRSDRCVSPSRKQLPAVDKHNASQNIQKQLSSRVTPISPRTADKVVEKVWLPELKFLFLFNLHCLLKCVYCFCPVGMQVFS